MNKVKVAVMTCPRRPNYLDRTLHSLFSSEQSQRLWVRVVVDGCNPAYLGKWKNHPRVSVELLSKERAVAMALLPIPRRIGETCFRCLAPSANEDLLLCQDDVEFSPGWLKATLDSAQEAEFRLSNRHIGRTKLSPDYALALYAPKDLRPNDKPLAAYKASQFYGTQAVFVPRQVMSKLVPFFGQARHGGEMDDMILKRFFIDYGITLHVINPNVVQHIGQHGTHAGKFHASPTYGKSCR